MGLSFLNGKSWAQVTRDERFFCAHLYGRIQQDGIQTFVDFLNTKGHELDREANWELLYEACFYRDLWVHQGREGALFSPKRTFDLGLLSDDAIVIIEAKAQQGFDVRQVEQFRLDVDAVKQATGVSRVSLLALCSSRYAFPDALKDPFKGAFDGTPVTWRELSALYDGDEILRRADDVYEQSPEAWFGANNQGGYMTGEALVAAHERGEHFFVGRRHGLHGAPLGEDIRSGRWRRQTYETHREATSPPNVNWFTLGEFVARLRERGPDMPNA